MSEAVEIDPSNRLAWPDLALAIVCIASSVVASALFLPRQSLWLDEAVQLRGVGLGPVEVVAWLAGHAKHDFGLADDRMPPVSYWAGWIWSQAFGLREPAMRWLGVVSVALATALVFLTARRAWGRAAAFAAGLLFAVSPNVIIQAVEIRAYPLFLLASAATYYCMVRVIEDRGQHRERWLAAMAFCCILTIYTHFFGLVSTGAAFLAVLVLVPRNGGRIVPVLAAIAVVGLATLGLIPFVVASVGLNPAGAPGPGTNKLIGLFRLCYRLIGHASSAVRPVALAIALVGVAVSGVCALAPKRRPSSVTLGIMIAVLSGLVVVFLAQYAQARFAALGPSYNVWLLPLLSLFLASGLAARQPKVRYAAAFGVTALLLADLSGARELAIHGEHFAHVSYPPVRDKIDHYGEGHVAILYDEDTKAAWQFYAPIFYRYGAKVPQYALKNREEKDNRLVDYPLRKKEVSLLELDPDYLIVIRSNEQTSAQIVDQVHNGIQSIEPGRTAQALENSGRWTRVEEGVYLSFVGARVDVFKRSPAVSRHETAPPL